MGILASWKREKLPLRGLPNVVVLKLGQASESPGGLINTQSAETVGLRWRMGISNKFPGDAAGRGWGDNMLRTASLEYSLCIRSYGSQRMGRDEGGKAPGNNAFLTSVSWAVF